MLGIAFLAFGYSWSAGSAIGTFHLCSSVTIHEEITDIQPLSSFSIECSEGLTQVHSRIDEVHSSRENISLFVLSYALRNTFMLDHLAFWLLRGCSLSRV